VLGALVVENPALQLHKPQARRRWAVHAKPVADAPNQARWDAGERGLWVVTGRVAGSGLDAPPTSCTASAAGGMRPAPLPVAPDPHRLPPTRPLTSVAQRQTVHAVITAVVYGGA
jgi:hypothetical protein